MDVVVTEDQRMLQDSTRRFLENRASIDATRRCIEDGLSFAQETWREGLELGWVALFVPEAFGGIAEYAGGAIDASIIAEELGRVVYPGPFLPACIAAFAIADAGSTEQQSLVLPALARGDILASPCFAGHSARSGTEPGTVRVSRSRNGYVLDGSASSVQHAEQADYFVVTTMDEKGGVSQFLVPFDAKGLTTNPLDPIDLGRSLAELHFHSVAVPEEALLGEYGNAAGQFERQLQLALVLHSAESVGVTDRVLEFTLEYVKQRYAFGRPIGSFQALKHRLADHAMQLEGARAAVAHAAQSVHHAAADAAAATSVAKAQSGKYGTEIIRDCLQMHGGIGMTWEHDIHLYLRRAVSNEALWGAVPVHYERLCRLARA